MRRLSAFVLLGLVVPAVAGMGTRASAQMLDRGRYIVEQVGMCHDCHTPREPTGQLRMNQSLQGGPIGSTPLRPMPWAEYAPALAGLPGPYTEARMATFLETGQRPDGSFPRPPMPPHRLSAEDARAVAAFLKSMGR